MNLRVTDSYTSWWKSIYSSSVISLNLPSPPKSSEDRRSKSQKRKADNSLPHDKDAKATRDSYEEQKGLQGDASISEELRAIHNVCFMVNLIRDKLLATPLCNIHGLHNEFEELFDYINAKNIDVPGFQEHKDEEQIQSQCARMDEIKQKRDELKRELLQLDEEESQLWSLLVSSEESLQKHVTSVKDLTDSHTSLEKHVNIAEEAATKLEEANKGLKDAHDSLKSFKWKL
ncbi:Autophagy protein 16 [Bienertia sinuspersici]